MALNATWSPGAGAGPGAAGGMQNVALHTDHPMLVTYLDQESLAIMAPRGRATWPKFVRFRPRLRDGADEMADFFETEATLATERGDDLRRHREADKVLTRQVPREGRLNSACGARFHQRAAAACAGSDSTAWRQVHQHSARAYEHVANIDRGNHTRRCPGSATSHGGTHGKLTKGDDCGEVVRRQAGRDGFRRVTLSGKRKSLTSGLSL